MQSVIYPVRILGANNDPCCGRYKNNTAYGKITPNADIQMYSIKKHNIKWGIILNDITRASYWKGEKHKINIHITIYVALAKESVVLYDVKTYLKSYHWFNLPSLVIMRSKGIMASGATLDLRPRSSTMNAIRVVSTSSTNRLFVPFCKTVYGAFWHFVILTFQYDIDLYKSKCMSKLEGTCMIF